MIAKYFLKRFLKITAIPAALIVSLQVQVVQKYILQSFAGSNNELDFSKISGFFPFAFTIEDLNFSNSDIELSVDKSRIVLNQHLINFKRLELDNLKIKTFGASDSSSIDLSMVVPILAQKVIRNFKANVIEINDEKITNLKFQRHKKSNKRSLEFESSLGKAEAVWNLGKSSISLDFKMPDVSFTGTYGLSTNSIKFETRYAGQEIGFDGCIDKSSMNGTLSIPEFGIDLLSNISLEKNVILAELSSEKYQTSGKFKYNLESKEIHIDKLIYEPLNIRLDPLVIRNFENIPNMKILLPGGYIDLKDIKFPSIGLINFNAADISKFNKIGIKGKLDGTGNFNDTVLNLKLNASDLRYSDIFLKSTKLEAKASKNSVNSKLDFKILNKGIHFDIDLTSRNWIPQKIKATSKGQFDLSSIMNSKNIKSANLQYDINAEGSLNDPKFSGSLKLHGMRYIDPDVGIYLKDINIDCALNGNEIFVKNIYAEDSTGKPGNIKGSGTMKFSGSSINTELAINIRNLKAIDQNWINARFDGSININGDLLNSAFISGALISSNPNLNITGLVIASARGFDLISPPKTKSKKKSQPPEFLKNLNLDVNLNVVPNIKIQGLGVESTWECGGKAFGTLYDPKYEAKITLKKGTFKVSDSSFKLKSGEILFNNDTSKIDISAEKKIDDITVGANLIQIGSDTNVRFYSTPYMSRNDVLSYILFDKSSSDISTSESLALFAIMGKLTSATAGFSITDKIKDLFGIDSIAIKKNNDKVKGEYDAISIGKKIGKLNVSIDHGSAKDTTNISVETRIAKNAKVSVDMSGKDSIGGGILWSKRY